jgi:hypothetical protein
MNGSNPHSASLGKHPEREGSIMLQRAVSNSVRVWILAFVMGGCSHGTATVGVQTIEAYPFRQTQGQVKVAMDPLFSKERAAAEFPGGEAFEEGGLLAVRVLIENGSRQAIRADRSDFRLVRANGTSEPALSAQDAFATVKPPVGWWAVLPILGPSASAYRNSDWLKQFEARALKDIPVRPEGSAAGLIYFYFPQSDKNLAGTRAVFVLRAESGEERGFDIALQGRRDMPGQGFAADPSAAANRPARTQPQSPTRVEGAGGGVIIRSPAQ